MEGRTMRACFQLALRPRIAANAPSIHIPKPQRCLATSTSNNRPGRSMPPSMRGRRSPGTPNFNRSRSITEDEPQTEDPSTATSSDPLSRLRVVPASASYFTALPRFTDDLLSLQALLRRHALLPTVPAAEAPRVAWLTYAQYTLSNTEPIRKASYAKLVKLLARLNQIHPALAPADVTAGLARFKRAVQPSENRAKAIEIDHWGRARAVGRRKSSNAVVWLVEGDGQVKINGRAISDMFSRLHDRESALWALKATQRVDKYNVWATVAGGGTTGQAEAITLAVAKALLVHEPALKPALRRAGCVTRDPRRVERKKHGKVKARKMPAWVKR